MLNNPKRSLERIAAVLFPAALIAKVLFDLFTYMHLGVR
jgi:hypothetical protein